mgnify:FL=1
MKEESFGDLLKSAQAMLWDRHPQERALIYAIAKLDPEERAAIIIAYERFIKNEDKE